MLEKLKYPIGQPAIPENISEKDIDNWIKIIEDFPSELEKLTSILTDKQLNTTYRENGWTIRQVIHHCADSHLNSYIRFKWTLTEDKPIIKAYFEERWAELFDSSTAPISLSIHFLKALHAKWVYLLKGLTNEDLNKIFIHPEGNKHVKLSENIGVYACHCNHHFAHINNLIISKNWYIKNP